MADYFPLLARAVSALGPNTKEQRQALYDRARKTLVEKLRDPTFSQADMGAESEALEAAIQRVEMDARRRAEPPPRPKPRPRQKAGAAPRPGYRDRPPLTDPKKPLRIAAGALAVALVLGAGWAVYNIGRAPCLTCVRLQPPAIFPRLPSNPTPNRTMSVCGNWFTSGRISRSGRSWSTSHRPFSTWYGRTCPRCVTTSTLEPSARPLLGCITLFARKSCRRTSPFSNRSI